MRSTFLLLLFPAFTQAAITISPSYLALPAGATTTSAVADGSGNVLLTGQYPIQGQISPQMFVAKLPPGGGVPLYFTAIALGCPSCGSGQIAVDGAGNAYVAGATGWAGFPTTEGVLESGLNGATSAGFVVKLNPAGGVVYSTLFGGGAKETDEPYAMAVNAAGEVFVTGNTIGGNFPLTSTAIKPENPGAYLFLMRISANADRVIYSVALGGTHLAVDSQSNAYLAGSGELPSGNDNIPVTQGAYQTSVKNTICSYDGFFAGFPCVHQYVLKVDPTGSNVLFATFVSGKYSDTPTGIAVDSAGNVYLTGVTGSTDYPVTSGAFQTKNLAPAVPLFAASQSPFQSFQPLANTGYLTKLSADGTQLLYSTYLGGSVTDAPSGLSIDSQGQAHVALQLQSPDFPGLPALPQRCLPDLRHYVPAAAVVSADGSSLLSLAIVEGSGPGNTAPLLASGSLIASDLTDGLTYLANTAAGVTPDGIACITDGADFTQAAPVSPGEVVTIFGSSLSAGAPAVFDPAQAQLPVALGGTSITVNGQAAPLMYVSPTQINFVLPYEIAGQSQATIQLNAPNGVTASRTLPVVDATPSFFGGDDSGYASCNGAPLDATGISVTVLNADGTFNSCSNPAKAGTTVFLFLNGTGVNNSASTGEIPSTPVALSPTPGNVGLTLGQGTSIPGTPLGVWKLPLAVPANLSPDLNKLGYYTFKLNGVNFRQADVFFWVTQ